MSEAKFSVGDCVEFKVHGKVYEGTILYVDVPSLNGDYAPYLVYPTDQSIPYTITSRRGRSLIESRHWSTRLSGILPEDQYVWLSSFEATLVVKSNYKQIPTMFLEGVEL